MNGILSFTIYAVIVYILLGGYKLRSAAVGQKKEVPCFNKKQLTTIAGIVVMVLMVMLLRINVGLVSFAVAAVLSFCVFQMRRRRLNIFPGIRCC